MDLWEVEKHLHKKKRSMEAHRLIHQDSGEVERYTDPKIIEAARYVMGIIHTDPASSETANKRVRAVIYYDKETDGLTKEWNGNVWMNHPFGRDTNARWINKLMAEFMVGRCLQFCCITFAATSENWFQPLMQFPQCFLSPRTNYYLPDGKIQRGVTKGSVVTYGGNYVDRFYDAFHTRGAIKIAYAPHAHSQYTEAA